MPASSITSGSRPKTQKGETPAFDFSKIGKSKRLAKQNEDFLDLLSVVEKSQRGMAAQQATLKSIAAKEAAKQLLRQLDLIYNMVLLPYLILITMEGAVHGWESALTLIIGGHPPTLDEKRKVFERRSKKTMQHFFALDVSGSLSRPWLSAITVYVWTAFECLAGDLWTSSLNCETRLGHQALKSLSNHDTDASGLSRRHIEVGLAARHGFDLRRTLGTILKSKFDFSSVCGIQNAYEQAFGTSGELAKFGSLKRLEQVRNLIVHRGGITDEKFVRVTKISARPGKPLPLTLSQVTDYMVEMTLSCLSLLKIVDEWFTTHT